MKLFSDFIEGFSKSNLDFTEERGLNLELKKIPLIDHNISTLKNKSFRYDINGPKPNFNNSKWVEEILTVDKFNLIIYLFLFSVIIFTAFGNALVCAAVFRERKLQTSTNLFLISLAVADFMVALFVMPSSLLSEILGYYPFGKIFCTIWVSLDVLCCTSSIYHMSTMALDRYLTIKFPLKYGRNKSKRITLVKITIVWLISIVICSPIFFLGLIDSSNVFDSNQICQLFNKKFRIYGSVFAFYVPFFVMLIAYVSTIRILKNVLDRKLVDKKLKMEENLRLFQKKTFSSVLEGLLIQTKLQLDIDSNDSVLARPQSISEKALIKRGNQSANQPNSSRQSRYSFVNYQSIKKIAQNEKKALKVLIIIFIVFVSLWCPFFVLNFTSGFCDQCIHDLFLKYESLVYTFILWLGYMSSMANPIVYTMFNKSFRTAFINILKCKKVSIEQPHRMNFKQPGEMINEIKNFHNLGQKNFYSDEDKSSNQKIKKYSYVKKLSVNV
ncbi:5-hydroxytryptamine receptor 2B [Brachionus plicatilis]|uniref:5-hydroxytryptamine receptor 2B n=1 Tax=Brachionus plicatilis TaxID=10195 RepID=A0A3M7SKR2_BRAPC|nr:5-hydroxytryptamine receptor 2B [Brachionus plicatilis]